MWHHTNLLQSVVPQFGSDQEEGRSSGDEAVWTDPPHESLYGFITGHVGPTVEGPQGEGKLEGGGGERGQERGGGGRRA